jgi:glutamyl/glutaminyl-tRNA synthetase
MIRRDDAARTRFAPAPTGYLHLGHIANAIHVWGLAAEAGARVLLRIEDHDRIRCRPEYDAALLEDVGWLGFRVDDGPVRQSADDRPYADAVEHLRAAGLVYGCACSRATFERWAEEHGAPWHGPGCPGECHRLGLDGPVWRVALGGGSERWMDVLVGPCADEVAAGGDPPIRDRDGNWTYLLAVVVDDLRQEADLVVRGRDLLASTPDQIRLGHLLGRDVPPTFAHHALVRRPDGSKLSKSAGDTGVRELRAAGHSADAVVAMAAAAVGYVGDPNVGRRPIEHPGHTEAHTR